MKINLLFFIGSGLITLLFACKPNVRANETSVVYANASDFVCGMKVKPEFTDTCHYDGKVYAFCSASCKEEFQANPVSFLSQETGH